MVKSDRETVTERDNISAPPDRGVDSNARNNGSAPPEHFELHGAEIGISAVTDVSFPHNKERGPWQVDLLFPKKLEGVGSIMSCDEGTAAFLNGVVQMVRPRVVLETGTHKGRSTRAIAEGLAKNGEGVIYTLDQQDCHIFETGAIPPELQEWVFPIIGKTPDVYHTHSALQSLRGIEMAYIDGDHTYEGVDHDYWYVMERAADFCVILIDNANDPGWPDVKRFVDDIPQHKLYLPSLTGMAMICVHRKR